MTAELTEGQVYFTKSTAERLRVVRVGGVGGVVLGFCVVGSVRFCGHQVRREVPCANVPDPEPYLNDLPTNAANTSDQSGWPPPTPLGSGAGQLLVLEATYGESGAGHIWWCRRPLSGGPLEIPGCMGEFAPTRVYVIS